MSLLRKKVLSFRPSLCTSEAVYSRQIEQLLRISKSRKCRSLPVHYYRKQASELGYFPCSSLMDFPINAVPIAIKNRLC